MGMYPKGLQSAQMSKAAEEKGAFVPLKFSSVTDRRGRDLVNALPVLEWEEHEKESERLIDQCESLYHQFLKAETTGKSELDD